MAMIGHDAATAIFQAVLESGRLHHGWLLSGPRGVGKASFASVAARWVLSEGAEITSERAAALLDAGTHPDCITLRRMPKDEDRDSEGGAPAVESLLNRNIRIDQVRAMQHALTTRPALGSRRVVIIDAVDDLEPKAANAILKSLEEPPAGTIFLLVTHSPTRLLATIRSRCRTLRFPLLHQHHMAGALAALLPESSVAEREALMTAGSGSPGQALQYAGIDMAGLDTAITAIIAGGDPDFTLRTDLARILSLKAAQDRYAAFLRFVPTRIAGFARSRPATDGAFMSDAWAAASALADRAMILNHNKQAVVMEMSRLLASLDRHKARADA